MPQLDKSGFAYVILPILNSTRPDSQFGLPGTVKYYMESRFMKAPGKFHSIQHRFFIPSLSAKRATERKITSYVTTAWFPATTLLPPNPGTSRHVFLLAPGQKSKDSPIGLLIPGFFGMLASGTGQHP